MKKKGFTLIELLAVIVILALIALIATPIVSNLINNTKKEVEEIGYDNYLRTVDTAILEQKMSGNKIPDGLYVVNGNGHLCSWADGINCSKPISIKVGGSNKPHSGSRVAIKNYKTVDSYDVVTTPSTSNEDATAKISVDYEIKEENGVNYVVLHLNATEDSLLATLATNIEFNSSKVTSSKYTKGVFSTDFSTTKDTIYKIISATKHSNATMPEGTSALLNIYFQINDGVDASDIVASDFKVYLSIYNHDGNSIFNVLASSMIEVVDMKTTHSSINSSSYTPGDVNNDGYINEFDLLLIRRMLFNMYDEVKAADVTGDGEVDIRDLTRMKKYMCGMDEKFDESPMTDVEDYLILPEPEEE